MECLLFQPHPHKKKIPAECWRAKKIICKRILEKKNFIVNQGVEKKFHDQTKSPTPPPPPPPPQKSNGRPLMHVSIVEERRNVLRRENTPAIRRNTRKGNRARICFYIRIFLKNFSSKPFSTIDAGSRV